jgi:hypothetical protein
MALQEKYAELISTAQSSGATNLQVREQDNVLYIDGEVPSGEVKDNLWMVYDKIDPDFRAGDVVMNINVAALAQATQLKVSTQSSNLNIRKGPGTDQPILGKATHEAVVTLLSKYNDAWYLIRTADGVEGYSSAEYLTAL